MRLRHYVASTAVLCLLTPAVAYSEVLPEPTVSAVATATNPPAPSARALATLTSTALRYESYVQIAEDHQERANARRSEADAAMERAEVYVDQVVDYAMSPSANSFAQKLQVFTGSATPEDLVNGMFAQSQITSAHAERVQEAKAAYDDAVRLGKQADEFAQEAKKAESEGRQLLENLYAQAEELGFGSSELPEGLPGTRAEQREWNETAVADWQSYKELLASAEIESPSAEQLRDPAQLEEESEGYFTAITSGNETIPGVAIANARGDDVEVLPSETVAFLDAIYGRIGDSYTSDEAAGRWTCSTLVTTQNSGLQLSGSPAQLFESTTRVPDDQVRPGDLVFLANDESGIHHVGVAIGNGQMIDASAARYQVGVSDIPAEPFAITRPSLGAGSNTAPQGSAEEPNVICNATEPVIEYEIQDGWLFPMERGTYRVSAYFGQTSRLWQTYHTGQDFAAPLGTPIYAARGGTVELREVGWAGTLITVAREDGTADQYAHTSAQLVSQGETVEAGQQIALVGARGNVTGPHLHFEILQDGTPVDPMPLLVESLAAIGLDPGDAWGGYRNGQVPHEVLSSIGDSGALRHDAALAYNELERLFIEEFGREIPLEQSYQDLVGQIVVGPDGTLTDIPGTSPFGWGTRFSTGELTGDEASWLATEAADLGWNVDGREFSYTEH